MTEICKTYKDDCLGNSTHSITVIKGGHQVNTIPGEAFLEANMRTIPAFHNQKMLETVQEVITELNQLPHYQLSLSVDFDKKPVKTNSDSYLINQIQKACQMHGRIPLPLLGISGTTDLAEFTQSRNTFEFAMLGPREPHAVHQIDEYVLIEDYLEMIEIYQTVMKEYFA